MARTTAKSTEAPTLYAIAMSGAQARPAGGRALSAEDGTTPTQRFTKDLIRVGTYTHPRHGWKLNVTTERIDKWLSTIADLRKNGVDIEITADHGTPGQRADKIRGYLIDAFREGDVMMGLVEMVGEDGIKLASTVKNVSIEIDDVFKDGKGNEYEEALTAVAICEKPVVPGQQPFRIAASAADKQTKIPVFTLADEPAAPIGVPMDLIKYVAQLTGKECPDEATAMAALKEWAEAKKAAGDKPAETPTTIVASLIGSADPDLIEDMAEAREGELDALVTTGKITPAVRDKLHASLIGKTGARRVMSLSSKVNKVTGGPMAKEVIEALKENDPVKLGEQTKGQRLSLARVTPGEDKSNDYDPEVNKQMLSLAGHEAKA